MSRNASARPTNRLTDEFGEAVASAIVAEELAITYPSAEEPAVQCPRVDIPEGAVTAFIGPNGSGKTTLLKAISKQLGAGGGRIRLRGREIDSFGSKELAREMGLLSQENGSLDDITVEELVGHGRYPYRGYLSSQSDEDRAAIDRALSLAGVDHLRDADLGQLSGGQKQLAWIAMVLAQETDVLLLDEPTTFLDLHHQYRVLETVRELNEERGVTIGVVLHDVAQAARFADYLIVMADGEPYDWGPPDRVITEGLLADVFDIEATVEYAPDIRILPERALPRSD